MNGTPNAQPNPETSGPGMDLITEARDLATQFGVEIYRTNTSGKTTGDLLSIETEWVKVTKSLSLRIVVNPLHRKRTEIRYRQAADESIELPLFTGDRFNPFELHDQMNPNQERREALPGNPGYDYAKFVLSILRKSYSQQ